MSTKKTKKQKKQKMLKFHACKILQLWFCSELKSRRVFKCLKLKWHLIYLLMLPYSKKIEWQSTCCFRTCKLNLDYI